MITVDLRGADKVFAANQKFRSQTTGTIVSSLRRSLARTAGQIRADLRSLPIVGGITRGKWGRSNRNRLTARVKRITLRVHEGAEVEAAIGLYGYPAVLEEGGRFVQHMIYVAPKGKRGAFSIRHPGAMVGGHGFGRSNFRRNESATLYQLDRDISMLMAKIYGV